MGKKTSTRKPKRESDKPAKEKIEEDRRDPAEIRAEEFRVGAGRETVEAFVVAFILALLFRAFLAEAFVIPTGSMAPTLMGAHKDIDCEQCGKSFQFGASRERSGPVTHRVVVAGVCPNCRFVNPLDLAGDRNDATFNGDRILVSKYTYTLSEPERWDVIVFKYPGNPKQNYIKRLVGLPNETLTIRHGDIYARPTGSEQRNVILRKPPSKLLAMSQLVYDTEHQPQVLIDANYPSRWQPWTEGASDPPTDSWKIERSADEGFKATVDTAASQRLHWLRYFHRWPDDSQWDAARRGRSLANVDPYSGRAITDFYTYDSYVSVSARMVYDEAPTSNPSSLSRFGRVKRMFNGGYSKGTFNRRYQSGVGPEQFGGAAEWGGQDHGNQGLGRDGMHWVGDLLLEADVETSDDSRELILELVEAGVKYDCRIDLTSGQATLSINDAEPRSFEEGTGEPTAQTSVRAGERHELRLSNCDDQLLLWVDGDVIEFDRPTTFDSRLFRKDAENHPHYSASDPLDAAPAGLAVGGGKCTVHSLRVDRDKYYIATNNSTLGIYDYDMGKLSDSSEEYFTHKQIQDVFSVPRKWATFPGWQARRKVTFELEEDQFFPMGDNSPESLDARCWAGTKRRIPLPRDVNRDAWTWSNESYVPRDLLVGKALVVFWPHSWNSPIPFTPNLKRMKLIR